MFVPVPLDVAPALRPGAEESASRAVDAPPAFRSEASGIAGVVAVDLGAAVAVDVDPTGVVR